MIEGSSRVIELVFGLHQKESQLEQILGLYHRRTKIIKLVGLYHMILRW